MTSSTIYTLGYAQWSIDEVESRLDALDAMLVDVRHSPHTSKPGFAKPALEARFADRYVHLPAFGNVKYKERSIELADPERGLVAIQKLENAPVLMCGCQHPDRCHRSVVAQRIADRFGGRVKHLRAPDAHAQSSLFDDPDT